jgi:hypothetical protein
MKTIETYLIDRKVVNDIIQCAKLAPVQESPKLIPKRTQGWFTKTHRDDGLMELFIKKV